MPKNVISVKFNPANNTGYTRDIGDNIFASSRFILPPDIPSTNVATIISAIGAELSDGSSPPCPEVAGGSLRKLVFLRSSGGSMSVPVDTRGALTSAAVTIRGVLQNAGDPVVCIKLEGEYFPNLNDELGLSYANTFAQSHKPPATVTRQYFYAGAINYEADSTEPIGGTIITPIKAISNNANAPATKFSTIWTTCVGAFVSTMPCPGGALTRKHRRFLVNTMTKLDLTATPPEAGQVELNEVPVSDNAAAGILTCGQAIAALNGVYCVGYRGESYNRFHKLLP